MGTTMAISYSEQVTLTCPSCGTDFGAAVWMLVDAAERPDLAQALLDGTLDVVACPHCGVQGPAGAPLLYHDGQQRRIYFAAPPDVEEHVWRDQAQSLLYLLLDELPEEARLPYLGDVQVEGDVAGIRRALMRRSRRTQAASAAPAGEPVIPVQPAPVAADASEAVLLAVEALLAADSAEEFQAIVARHPVLVSPVAESTITELISIAQVQNEPAVADALQAARASLAELRGLVNPVAAMQTAPAAPTLSDAAYQRLLLVDDNDALLDATRDHPALLEPWADAVLAERGEAALDEGNERIATLIGERRDALAALRARLGAEDALLEAIRALLLADDEDTMAVVITEYPILLTDAAQDALFGLAAGARVAGDESQAADATARRDILRQIREAFDQA